MMTRHYTVAGHTFAVSGSDELFEQMGNYEPFRCEGGEPLFTLTECSGVVPEYTEEFRQVVLLLETTCLNLRRERSLLVV